MSDSPSYSLWRRLVAVLRLIAIFALTLLVALSLSVGRAVLFATPRAKRRWRIWHFKLWSRTSMFLLGARTEWHGEPPEAPFFLASNHLGYLDIVALAQRVDGVFLSKVDVRGWPVVGWLTTLADTLYINRERTRDIPRANAAINAVLQSGDGVVLFPEGTSSESDFALPIKPSLLQMPATEGYPVHTVAVHFETRTGDPHAHRAICYYGDMEFASHVWNLLHLRGFTATIRFAAQSRTATDRKLLAQMVRTDIHALQSHNFPDPDDPEHSLASASNH